MKEPLEDFIEKNRQSFDDREPPASAWRAIESKLPGGRQVVWNSLTFWRIAAVLLLATSVYFFMTRTTTQLKEGNPSQLEFNDLESFYATQIAEKVALINELETGVEGDDFTQNFKQLDAMYQVLREEMKNHPSQKVKDALILNLLVRIDLLNQQIKRLEDSRKPAPGPHPLSFSGGVGSSNGTGSTPGGSV